MALVVVQLVERVVVALVEEDQLAVARELVDEADREPWPGVRALLVVLEVLEVIERLAAERVEAQVQLEQDVFLALEVVVERGLGDAEPLGDLAQ